ncbi:MAG: cupin domain-containing protein [Planctomycetota bacterium]
MQRVRARDCEEITAQDGCRLRELLHPDKDDSGVPYSLALARIDPGGATDPHKLLGHREVYLILEGEGEMHIGDEVEAVGPGDAIVIPADAVQWIANTGETSLRFACLVDPPWQSETDVSA